VEGVASFVVDKGNSHDKNEFSFIGIPALFLVKILPHLNPTQIQTLILPLQLFSFPLLRCHSLTVLPGA